MEPFDAVVTTGIYCRPRCPARPQPQNRVQFPLAAAAEAAGYRACLRCRPYRTPAPPTPASSELVCRAVQLILDGLLDDGTEQALSGRMGLSARHLRRLFTEQLGVTPDGLARSARTHFARRLLDDTDLTVTDVAFAAGFGSLRQFNRSCQDIFRLTPQQLRAKRRHRDRLVADGGLLLRLTHRGPLDWPGILTLFAADATPGVEAVSDGSYRRTIVVGGYPGALELTAGTPGEMLLRLHLPRWDGLMHLVGRARRLASLDLDLAAAAMKLADDQVIAPLLAERPGLRPPGTWDGYETGVRLLLDRGDREGARAAGRLVRRFGTPVAGLRPLGLTHMFPPPRRLATAPLEELGLPVAAADAIRTFARTAPTLRLDREVPLSQLLADLSSRGLDQQTANQLALRLGEPDADPLAAAACGESHSPCWSPWKAVANTHQRLRDLTCALTPSDAGSPAVHCPHCATRHRSAGSSG